MTTVKKGFWGALFGAPQPKVRVVVASPSAPLVARENKSLLEKRGWQKKGEKHFAGHYASKFGTFRGDIRWSSGEWLVFINNPPNVMITDHPKRCCCHKRNDGWWLIHLHTMPVDGDVNAIIAYVERILAECYEITKGR